jgi:hypothetical protein
MICARQIVEFSLGVNLEKYFCYRLDSEVFLCIKIK